MKTSTLLIAALIVGLASPAAKADDSAGFANVFKSFFGSASDNRELKSCANLSGHLASPMGRVNAFFCRMEKEFGLTQVPTTANPVSVTKTFDVDRKIHVEMVGQAGAAGQVAPGFNDDGTVNASMGYDYLAKVWFCKPNGAVTCASPADFNLGIAIAFSYAADGTLNKGYMLQEPGAVNLSATGSFMIQYNMSSVATKRSMVAKHIDSSGNKYNVSAYRDSANLLSAALVNLLNAAPNANRFSGKVNLVSGTASALYDQPLSSSVSVVAGSAGTCYTRGDDGIGDWRYIPAAISCPAVDNFADSPNGVSGYSSTTILGISGANWTNGLTVATHPSTI